VEIKDIKKLPFDIRWKDISANCFDEGTVGRSKICGTSFDDEYCFVSIILENTDNPMIHIHTIYKNVGIEYDVTSTVGEVQNMAV
jgi:hypothetical protein